MSRRAGLLAATLLFAASDAQAQQAFPQPLAEEPIPVVETLPERYPDSFVFVHDLHFKSIPDGRAALVDVSSPVSSVKGQIPVAQFGTLLPSTTGSEIYAGETFLSRLTRGERTDVVSIWDKATLAHKGEIVLPGGKRGMFVTLKNAMQFTNGEKWMLVFNFTPGSSVTVIDLEARTILGDIDLPGCMLTYPTGARGFTSLCADGTMMTVLLDEVGKAKSTTATRAVNDIDNDPWFMMPAMAGRTAWFVSFKGRLHGFDLSGDKPRDLGGFAMVPGDAAKGWRPGGWQVTSADAAGHVYVLMDPNGAAGSHKNGGTEVWVADTAKKAVARKITMQNHTLSIEVTAGAKPYLVASRPDGNLDVYDANSGTFLHTVAQAVNDPMTMTAAGK
ncbi:amine dehydrogenase large subunit [Sphingosinicella soli]|uniref:Methylamine dehydrogenase heavy chain n=1 Tax=Sphingosinicella soli TaxID=333708 RepID=A0A7W7B107_9SPHN|nr:amine dehydrogenase large subunit [Sphingosinicella soli]MBB4630992.1 methylamine dehydrogenase heavy chain [Sphingosinicella soli]